MQNSDDESGDSPSSMPAHTADLPVSAADVIDRMKSELGVKSDTQLAEIIGKSSKTIHSWRVRNSVPYEAALLIAFNHRTSLDYLLLGRHQSDAATFAEALEEEILRPKIANFLEERAIGLSASGVPFLAVELASILARSYASDRRMMKMLVDGGYMTRDEFLRFLKEYGSITKYDEFITRHAAAKQHK